MIDVYDDYLKLEGCVDMLLFPVTFSSWIKAIPTCNKSILFQDLERNTEL